MKLLRRFATPLLILLSATALWQSGAMDQFKIGSVTPQEALEAQKSGRAQIVDVREADEIRSGMVKDAVWLPLSSVQTQDALAQKTIAQLDRKKVIYVYCRSGSRSAKVAAQLQGQGFEVRNLGGFSALQSAGFPTMVPTQKAE